MSDKAASHGASPTLAVLAVGVLLALAALAGCAATANDQMGKLEVGMTSQQVKKSLGPPEAIKRVRFPGYSRDYLVWEYSWVPETPACPSEGVSRVLTGMMTLGVSEVGWTHAKARPHWVYFLDDHMVYTSKAVDCQGGACRAWLDISDPNFGKN